MSYDDDHYGIYYVNESTRVRVELDTPNESPREWSPVGQLFYVGQRDRRDCVDPAEADPDVVNAFDHFYDEARRRRRYLPGCLEDGACEELARWHRVFHGVDITAVVVEVDAYDGSRVVLYARHDDMPDGITVEWLPGVLRAEGKVYGQWARGEVFTGIAEERETVELPATADDDPVVEWHEVDGLGDIYVDDPDDRDATAREAAAIMGYDTEGVER